MLKNILGQSRYNIFLLLFFWLSIKSSTPPVLLKTRTLYFGVFLGRIFFILVRLNFNKKHNELNFLFLTKKGISNLFTVLKKKIFIL